MTKKTITMTDRAPVTIDEAAWPCIAKASWHSGEHRSQANEEAWMRVREHADGRRIVYGKRDAGNGGMPVGYRGRSAGFLVDNVRDESRGRQLVEGGPVEYMWPDADETIRAIRRVAGLIDMGELGNELIADLPAEELE